MVLIKLFVPSVRPELIAWSYQVRCPSHEAFQALRHRDQDLIPEALSLCNHPFRNRFATPFVGLFQKSRYSSFRE